MGDSRVFFNLEWHESQLRRLRVRPGLVRSVHLLFYFPISLCLHIYLREVFFFLSSLFRDLQQRRIVYLVNRLYLKPRLQVETGVKETVKGVKVKTLMKTSSLNPGTITYIILLQIFIYYRWNFFPDSFNDCRITTWTYTFLIYSSIYLLPSRTLISIT